MQSSSKRCLLEAMEAHMTALVREAMIVQRHSKRTRHSKRCVWLLPGDIQTVLQWRGSDKLYGSDSVVTQQQQQQVIALNQFVQSEPNGPPPSEVTMTLHWLAVDGVQPAIAMNPEHPDRHTVPPNHLQDVVSLEDEVSVQNLLPKLLSEELQLYYQRITRLLRSEQSVDVYADAHNFKAKSIDGYLLALHALRSDQGIQELVPFFVHFFTHIFIQQRGILGMQPEWAFRGIRGLLALLFNPHVHLELHLHQILPLVFSCLVVKSPPAINVEPTESYTPSTSKNATHWDVRRWAALCIYSISQKFYKDYTTLQPRVIKTLVEAMQTLDKKNDFALTPTDAGLSYSTVYGALIGLGYFGARIIDSFILPMACEYWTRWEQVTHRSFTLWIDSWDTQNVTLTQWKESYYTQAQEAIICQEALLVNLAIFFRNVSVHEQCHRLDYDLFEVAYGEKIIPLQGNTLIENSPYWTCFI